LPYMQPCRAHNRVIQTRLSRLHNVHNATLSLRTSNGSHPAARCCGSDSCCGAPCRCLHDSQSELLYLQAKRLLLTLTQQASLVCSDILRYA
jgi:hypothetical protein